MEHTLSNEPGHKLHAVVVLRDRIPEIAIPESYIEACRRWHDALSESAKAIAAAAFRAFNEGDFEKAVAVAEALPPAPRMP